jgi:hypothetical protein
LDDEERYKEHNGVPGSARYLTPDAISESDNSTPPPYDMFARAHTATKSSLGMDLYGSRKRSDNTTPDKSSISPKFAADGATTPD